MHTIKHRHPDGTCATYTVAPGSTLPMQIMALKPVKGGIGRATDKRLFPKHQPHWSVAKYVKEYFALNSHHKVAAFQQTDPLALYHPLPDTPAATYAGLDSVEVLP